ANQVLSDMAAAMQETDPAKKQQLWSTAMAELQQTSKEFKDATDLNDVGQMIFNVLYSQLGESGLQEALSNGYIPANFANTLAGYITASPDENLNSDAHDNAGGTPTGWNHQESGDFLRNNLPPSSSTNGSTNTPSKSSSGSSTNSQNGGTTSQN